MSRRRETAPRAPALRRRMLLLGVLCGAGVIIARTGQLTLREGVEWAERAEQQQEQGLALPAPRGTIYDRNGVPLAASRDVYRIAIAPREVIDRERVIETLIDAGGVSARDARRATDVKRRWVVLRGRFGAAAREALDGIQGVHFETVQQRFYPHGTIAHELLGR
ncbi:MAG: hypothetical protein ACYC28_06910, partial [Longimicrobiales bacterium]